MASLRVCISIFIFILFVVILCGVVWLFAVDIVEQAEGILVAIVQQSVEFAVCYLEKSGFHDDDDDLGLVQVCLGYFANLVLYEVPWYASLMKVVCRVY